MAMNGAVLPEMNIPTVSVTGEIEFLRRTSERAFTYGYDQADREAPENTVFDKHRLVIRDARAAPIRLSLDQHGATFLEHQSSVHVFDDEQQIIDRYYPESAEVIKTATGASRVLIFDHNIRLGHSLTLQADQQNQGRPVMHAHTDFTEASAVRRLQDLVGDEAVHLLHHRVMQVNLWRPIRGPVRDAPLAVCDASSIGPQGLAPVDLIYPHRRGEIYYLSYDPAQRWFFLPDMLTTEAWIFKNFDSEAVGAIGSAAHSAFNDPRPYTRSLPRESIEVRAFAFFDS
jgi:hypothetical protein